MMGKTINREAMLFILLFTIIVYSNTIYNGFVYDDDFTIVNNTLIKNLSNLPILFTKDYFLRSAEMSYRPFVTLSYFLDYAVYGLKPWGFHLTNMLLHAMNGILLYMFLTLFMKQSAISGRQSAVRSQSYSSFIPLLTSLLFAGHPALTETVNCISYREDLLMFAFYFATLILYLKVRNNSASSLQFSTHVFYCLSCLLYFLALLSKEMAATMPLVLCCYELVYERKGKALRAILFNRYIIGYTAVTFLYLYLRFFYFYSPLEERIVAWSLPERIMTAPWFFMNYLKFTLFPVSLSAHYLIYPVRSISSSMFIGSVSTMVLISVMIYKTHGIPKNMLFGLLFIGITLLPVYNIIPIANPFADRYLYLPIVGFVLVCSSYLTNIFEADNRSIANFVLFISIAILSMYCLTSEKRNEVWRDNLSLWSDAVKKAPASARVRNNLGVAYLRGNRNDEAMAQFKIAVNLREDDIELRNTLGVIYHRQGRLKEAEEEFKKILRMSDDAKTHNNLGAVYLDKGLFDEAIKEFERALKINHDYALAHMNLGKTYNNKGMLEYAKKEYEIALEIDPYNPSLQHEMGKFYNARGAKDKAIKAYVEALELMPSSPEIHNDLGIILAEIGDINNAVYEFQIAIEQRPEFANAYYNLGNAYSSIGKMKEAIIAYNQSVRLKPNSVETHFNLGNAYLNSNSIKDARKEFERVLELAPGNEMAVKALKLLNDRENENK